MPRCRNCVQHPVGEALEIGLGVVAAADARLVGDDDRADSRGSAAVRAQLEDAGHELEILDAVDVVLLDVDDAVAVEEQRLAPACVHGRGADRAKQLLRAGEVLGDADVDEQPVGRERRAGAVRRRAGTSSCCSKENGSPAGICSQDVRGQQVDAGVDDARARAPLFEEAAHMSALPAPARRSG